MKSLIAITVLTMTSSSAFALNSICEISEPARRLTCVLEDNQGKLMKIGFACGEDKSCQDKREEFRTRVQDIQNLPKNSIDLCMVNPDC